MMNETYAANYENPKQYLGTADQALPNIHRQLSDQVLQDDPLSDIKRCLL
jgi:hypothetical protein